MSILLFHDTCTLFNLALVGLLPKVKKLFKQNLYVTPTVKDEIKHLCCKKKKRDDLYLEVKKFWTKVQWPSSAELLQAQAYKNVLDTPGHCDHKENLGEAETIAIIVGSFAHNEPNLFISDDGRALALARKQPEVTAAFGTKKILELLEKAGIISQQENSDYRRQLWEKGEFIR